MNDSAEKQRVQVRFLEEAVRTLRANLLVRMQLGAKIFTLASARPGEGKSTVAALLAQSMTAVRKVLVIEADMRRPRVAVLLGARSGAGLSDLGPSHSLSSLVQNVNGVAVIRAGSGAQDPQQLFTSQDFRKLLEAARASYDLILVDTPPVLACADATLIATLTDGVLLVARAGEVLVAEAVEARKRFESCGAAVVGGIITGMGSSETAPYANYVEDARLEEKTQQPTSILAAARAVGIK